MKNSEIRELSTQDVVEKIAEEKARLVRMRLNHEVTPMENPNQMGETRKLIAKLKTELRARELKGNA